MIFLDNKLVSEKDARISVFDHGFLYGDGIYETMRVYRGVAFMIDAHIDRLYRSASMIRLNIGKSSKEVKDAVYTTLRANGLKDAVVRISISRGAGPLGLDPALCPKTTFVIMANRFHRYPARYYKKGIAISVVNTRRNFRGALNPQIKSLNFLNNILAKIESLDSGTYEAIMLNYQGYIAEGTITNVFFVRNKVLCTPGIEVGILDGITRRMIIDIARESGIRVRTGKFRKQSLLSADEAFISNTNIEIMPVARIDSRKKFRRPGPVTSMIHNAYWDKVSAYIRHEVSEK